MVNTEVRNAYIQKAWNELKQKIYSEDGSLRDIYVLNTNIDDWRKLSDYVNTNYAVQFNASDVVKDKIDIDHILKCWNGNEDEWASARIKLSDTININTHFFCLDTIEQDIDPREFNSIEDHQVLMQYMQGLFDTLGKPVLLTAENVQEAVCIRVDCEDVEYT